MKLQNNADFTNMNKITSELIASADEKYREFVISITPNATSVLGVRAPVAKRIAKKYAKTVEGEEFMSSLPHTYHDEYITHAYMLGFMSEDEILEKLKSFLPHMSTWAIVDSTVASIKQFFKSRKAALDFSLGLLDSDREFIVRFGIVSLLDYFLDGEYASCAINAVKGVKSDKFYVKMAQAWFFATALTKQYGLAIKVIESSCLDVWVHNKSIQKARESYCVSDETKQYLKTLRR